MADVICFGELMMRLTPPGHARFLQASSFELEWGGAEANAAVALAQLGVSVDMVTAFPEGDIGQAAINALRSYGVGVGKILRREGRVGIYFHEKGASQRPSRVIYDRKGSSAALADPSEYDWGEILRGARWFHFTGITPAISAAAAQATEDALKTAKRLGIKVSCDLNFRKNLWDAETAGKTMSRLLHYTDVLACGLDDLAAMFGIKTDAPDRDNIPEGEYIRTGAELKERFGITTAVFSMRKSISSSENDYAVRLYDAENGELYDSAKYHIIIVDRIGGGDAADAGVIYGMLKGYSPQKTADFAAACAAFKHSVEGDFTSASKAEIDALIESGGSGRVSR